MNVVYYLNAESWKLKPQNQQSDHKNSNGDYIPNKMSDGHKYPKDDDSILLKSADSVLINLGFSNRHVM